MSTESFTPVLAVPIGQQERILIIDSLRSITIPGILLMNVPGFGIAPVAISDYSLQPQGNINYYFWYVFGPGVFEGSQRGIFSMLYGAGMDNSNSLEWAWHSLAYRKKQPLKKNSKNTDTMELG